MASVVQIEHDSYSTLAGRELVRANSAPVQQHFGTTQLTSLDGQVLDELYFFAKVPNIEVSVQAMIHVHFHGQAYNRRAIEMKRLFDVNLHDVAVMVGLGCFTGSSASVVWGLFSASPAPSVFIIPVAAIGFGLGKFVSDRSDRHTHATNN